VQDEVYIGIHLGEARVVSTLGYYSSKNRVLAYVQSGPKSKPLANDQKIVLKRNKAGQ